MQYCCPLLYKLYISNVHIAQTLLHNILQLQLQFKGIHSCMWDTFYVYVGDAVIEKEGRVRLVGGAQPHEGLVEMFLFGRWGTLCRSDYRYIWTLSNASTICQHLGYAGAAAALSRAIYVFQKGSGPTWYLNFENCVGNKVNLRQCSRSVYCSEYGAVGVICTGRLCKYVIYSNCILAVICTGSNL